MFENGISDGQAMAGVTGLEPAASGVTGRRSNQLSYTPLGIPGGGSIYCAYPRESSKRAFAGTARTLSIALSSYKDSLNIPLSPPLRNPALEALWKAGGR
jgi:hypothetical protein